MTISRIIIHCAATINGRQLSTTHKTAADIIDEWHKGAGFQRGAGAVSAFNPHLHYIGYQYVIDTDGTVETGRAIGETGAHTRGYNKNSIGICLVGTDKFTPAQWQRLAELVSELRKTYSAAKIVGHRDCSPDRNGDGVITPDEWVKICPGFNVFLWLKNGMTPPESAVYG
jgi:N-acetylmuramoyl-L-alanine amidase